MIMITSGPRGLNCCQIVLLTTCLRYGYIHGSSHHMQNEHYPIEASVKQAYTMKDTEADLYFTPMTSIFLCHPSLTYLRERTLIDRCSHVALPAAS